MGSIILLSPAIGIKRSQASKVLSPSPTSINQQGSDIPGQVGRQQRQGLALGARQIRADANQSEASDGPIENHFAGVSLARSDLRRQEQATQNKLGHAHHHLLAV